MAVATLRMSEEEYRELMRRRGETEKPLSHAARDSSPFRGALPDGENGVTSSGPAGHLPPRGKALGDAPGKRAKYGNRRVEVDGLKFDSAHEAKVYQELMLRVKAGELKCVIRQVPFDLPGGIRYIADFVTIAPDMSIEGVYDAKSEITKKNRVYINKKKQVRAMWGIEIREV